MANSEEGTEPMTKRQKCGDGVVPSPSFGGGPMYDDATARKMLRETVLINEDAQDELTAEELEDEDLHFDPDKLDSLYYVDDSDFWAEYMTAMTYFAKKGDAKMCRYLISRGASTTQMDDDEDEYPVLPMYEAAYQGYFVICKLLYENGAQNDIWRYDKYQWCPIHAAAYKGHDEVVRWFVLQGALCADTSSEEMDEDRIYPTYHVVAVSPARKRMASSYKRLVEWAKEVTQCHSSVVMFLLGTLPPAPDTDKSRTLQCLSGFPGVRKHIGDFVGMEVTKRKHLRILRNVVGGCAAFLQ